jgi:hypothetical protein
LVTKSKSKLYYDRQSVGQFVLISGTHLGPVIKFSHSLFDYFFLQFRVCWCGAPSLARSRVCTFQFLPGIASAAFLRSESHGTQEHSLVSLFLRLPQPGEPGSCIYFPQEQRSPTISSGIMGLFYIQRVTALHNSLLQIYTSVCESVTQQWLFYSILFGGRCLASGQHATIPYSNSVHIILYLYTSHMKLKAF